MRAVLTLLLLVPMLGCALPHARATQFRPLVTAQSAAQPAVVAPRAFTVVWNPGGYAHFVVVTSPDLTTPLVQWPTLLETDTTNFQFVADEPQRYFTLYGTNAETGENAWAGEQQN